MALHHHDWIANHALRQPDKLAVIDLATVSCCRFRGHHL